MIRTENVNVLRFKHFSAGLEAERELVVRLSGKAHKLFDRCNALIHDHVFAANSTPQNKYTTNIQLRKYILIC